MGATVAYMTLEAVFTDLEAVFTDREGACILEAAAVFMALEEA